MHMERIPETFYPPHPQRNIETEVVTAQRRPRKQTKRACQERPHQLSKTQHG